MSKDYTKDVKMSALADLLKNTYTMPIEHRAMLHDSLAQYVLYGYIEAPGANLVPFKHAEDIPRNAVDEFREFLVANGEDPLTVDAEIERGVADMENTVGAILQ